MGVVWVKVGSRVVLAVRMVVVVVAISIAIDTLGCAYQKCCFFFYRDRFVRVGFASLGFAESW